VVLCCRQIKAANPRAEELHVLLADALHYASQQVKPVEPAAHRYFLHRAAAVIQAWVGARTSADDTRRGYALLSSILTELQELQGLSRGEAARRMEELRDWLYDELIQVPHVEGMLGLLRDAAVPLRDWATPSLQRHKARRPAAVPSAQVDSASPVPHLSQAPIAAAADSHRPARRSWIVRALHALGVADSAGS
jgi:phytoene dehydrogenase-like protein